MAITACEQAPPTRVGRTPPFQPDYPDELSDEQLDAIRRLTDPDGTRQERRTLLHAPAW